MIEPGREIFIDAGTGARRFLTAFRVARGADRALTLRAADREGAAPAPGQTVTLCYHSGQGFMRVDGRVSDIDDGGAVRVDVLGEPRACDSREVFRVGVEGAGFVALLNGRSRCDIIDVCPIGLGVLSKDRRFADEGVQVEFALDARTYKGPCVVRDVRQTPRGWRAGLEVMNSAKAGTLGVGLQKLTMQAQRLRLQRDHENRRRAA